MTAIENLVSVDDIVKRFPNSLRQIFSHATPVYYLYEYEDEDGFSIRHCTQDRTTGC
jgi:hypothetical protein